MPILSMHRCHLALLALCGSWGSLGLPALAAPKAQEPATTSASLDAPVTYPSSAEQLTVADTSGVKPAGVQIAQATDSTPVKAYYRDGFYLTILGSPVQSRKFAEDFIGRATFADGTSLGGAVGYRWGDFRFEGEIQYFTNGFDTLTFFQPGTTIPVPGPSERSPGATVSGRSIMFNVYYDYPLSEQWRPYLGLGAGVYTASINGLSPPGFGGFVAFGDSPDRFAYQLRLGIAYAVDPNFEILAGFRYFKGDQFEYTIRNSDFLTGGNGPLVLRPNGLETQSVELGLRYNF